MCDGPDLDDKMSRQPEYQVPVGRQRAPGLVMNTVGLTLLSKSLSPLLVTYIILAPLKVGLASV